MIVVVPPIQAKAILGAMRSIAMVHGGRDFTENDRLTLEAAARIVFGLDPGTGESAVPIDPPALAARLSSDEAAAQAMRMLAVMSLVDGKLDAVKEALVKEYAAALGITEDYLNILGEAVTDELDSAKACMIRKNAATFPLLDTSGIEQDAIAPFLPYREAADPELEAKYETLASARPGTFGRAFYDHFMRNGFAFPGNPSGLAEGFTTPHDSSHVLSGYSTSQQGELCVSTFIGAMHPDHPMAAEVLPVMFSWHLGVHLNDIAGASTGAFEPNRFWTAWRRGEETTTDIVAADWDFWAATEADLDDLRSAYSVRSVDRELLA